MRAKPGVYSLGGAGSPKALLKRRACVVIYKHFSTNEGNRDTALASRQDVE